MIVAMVATGMRLISPQTLFFPFVLLLAATAFLSRQRQQDAHRGGRRRTGRLPALPVGGPGQHPDPGRRAARRRAMVASGPGGRWPPYPDRDGSGSVTRTTATSWWCGPARTHAPLDTALRVNDTADEIDLEPVSHSALRSLLDTQRTVRDVPTGIDLTKVSRITVLGDADEVRAALRAWIAQAVTWHDPTVLGVAVATPDLESPDWSWLKWLPHVDIPGRGRRRRPGPLPVDQARRAGRAAGAGAGRPPGVHRRAGRCVAALADHRRRPGLRPERLAPGGWAGPESPSCTARPQHRTANSIRIPKGRSCASRDGAIERWQTGGWQRYIDSADQLGADDAAHLARRLSRWDSNPTHSRSAVDGHPRRHLHDAAGNPGRVAAGCPDAVGAATPRRRVAGSDRCHRDR